MTNAGHGSPPRKDEHTSDAPAVTPICLSWPVLIISDAQSRGDIRRHMPNLKNKNTISGSIRRLVFETTSFLSSQVTYPVPALLPHPSQLPVFNNDSAHFPVRQAPKIRPSASIRITFGLLGMQKPCIKQSGPGTGCPTRPAMLLLHAKRWSGARQLSTRHILPNSNSHPSAEKSITDILNL